MATLQAINQEYLVLALRQAAEDAAKFKDTEDGGTCNLDSAVFWPGRTKKEVIEAAAAESGVDCFISEWFGRRCVFVCIGSGQGNRRSRMAKAAYESLKLSGLDASIYYQMD